MSAEEIMIQYYKTSVREGSAAAPDALRSGSLPINIQHMALTCTG